MKKIYTLVLFTVLSLVMILTASVISFIPTQNGDMGGCGHTITQNGDMGGGGHTVA